VLREAEELPAELQVYYNHTTQYLFPSSRQVPFQDEPAAVKFFKVTCRSQERRNYNYYYYKQEKDCKMCHAVFVPLGRQSPLQIGPRQMPPASNPSTPRSLAFRCAEPFLSCFKTERDGAIPFQNSRCASNTDLEPPCIMSTILRSLGQQSPLPP
jgi:hypothetical protein